MEATTTADSAVSAGQNAISSTAPNEPTLTENSILSVVEQAGTADVNPDPQAAPANIASEIPESGSSDPLNMVSAGGDAPRESSSRSESAWNRKLMEVQIEGYRRQNWMDTPNDTDCPHGLSTLEYNTLVQNHGWTEVFNVPTDPNNYWKQEFTTQKVPVIAAPGTGKRNVNDHRMATGVGYLIIQDVNRTDGPRV
ncbi:uncharacterized protein N7511_010896 [Penicillium nucicola]|uniref:uncharacterized protein n=1 Tax=Penicillium nucicola TaxID=1850975 RepID=UPI0025454BF3|nr:uncharacterized protein N7511_010896 [Penicillium nucicola]KAJ5749200.1 hypothetical protein N7511_010896 [Penicillium nucicola]